MSIQEVYSPCIIFWGGGLTSKILSVFSRLFSLQDSGETVKTLLSMSAFVLMTVIMQKSPVSYQNWSMPSSKMLIRDSCARELNIGNTNQIFMDVKSASFKRADTGLT